jgi:type IV secretory pathway VirB2 component (pilin)
MPNNRPASGLESVRADGRAPFVIRDLPDPPRQLWRIIGPGIVGAGVALSSGEFILWPFIALQVGLVFLWGALIGSVTQFFLNMEVERYTLATGETALSGFNRVWKHWGLVLAIMVYFANLWPGWALSSATLLSFLTGGSPTLIAVVILIVLGAGLTFAPVVYVALERLLLVKVLAVGLLVVLAVALAIDAPSWEALPGGLIGTGGFPSELGFALLFLRWCLPAAEADRTCARATGSATRVSAWGSTCRAW